MGILNVTPDSFSDGGLYCDPRLAIEHGLNLAAQGAAVLLPFVRQGRELHFIRPSTRTQVRAPVIPPESLQPLPADLVLTRAPRHPQRKCGRGEERR